MKASCGVNRKPKTGRALGGVKMLWDDAYAETKELKKYRRKYISKTKLDEVVDAALKKRLVEIFPQDMPSPTRQHTPRITQQP